MIWRADLQQGPHRFTLEMEAPSRAFIVRAIHKTAMLYDRPGAQTVIIRIYEAPLNI